MATFLATLFLIVCILLVIVVLLQKGRGGGLGGAFGGAGSSAFGTRTGDVFTWVTIVLVGVFLLLAVVLVGMYRPRQVEQVKAPTFIPPSKPIDKAISVTIQAQTGKSLIFYTIGTPAKPPADPAQRGARPYEAGVRVEPGAILKARAFLRGWQPSEVAEAHYPRAPATQPAAATTAPGQ